MAQIKPTDIERHLGGIDYPASKREIIEQARANGADWAVVRKLEEIRDRRYDGPTSVMQEVTGDF
jgi:uncharacterized protein DUF2795